MGTKSEEMTENVEADIEVLEEAAREGRPPRHAQRYKIRVDKENLIFDAPSATGREILIRAGKTPPEGYLLVMKLHGGQQRTIALDDTVDFSEPGVERFVTLPRDQHDGGEGDLRKRVALPETDRHCLDAQHVQWETILERNQRWLLVHDLEIPDGYDTHRAMVALQLPPGYPDAPIDMVYFHPPLHRRDGRGINALSALALDGKEFQRWSRHRSKENPWRPGEDDICTHLTLVSDWLRREVADLRGVAR